MTTSIAEYCSRKSSSKVIQEPMISRVIFIFNNINARTSYAGAIEHGVCLVLILYLKLMCKIYKQVVYVDPFTSHSVTFRDLFARHFPQAQTIQMNRQKEGWVHSSLTFKAFSWRSNLKKYIPFHTPSESCRYSTEKEMYALEYEYRMENQVLYRFDLLVDYEDLITPTGSNRLKNFLMKNDYITKEIFGQKFEKINTSL